MISQPHNRFALICLCATFCLAGPAGAQSLDDWVEDLIDEQVESALVDALEQSVEAQVNDAIETDLADAMESVPRPLDRTLAGIAEILPSTTEEFVASIDDQGNRVEHAIRVLLVTPEQFARIEPLGLAVREQRVLRGLGMILLRIETPRQAGPAADALRMAIDDAKLQIDFNHLYDHRSGASEELDPRGAAAAARDGHFDNVSIAIVDSAVASSHAALREAMIVQKDFVPYGRVRPSRHGTAVASILVGDSDALQGRLPGARLYAASVFFEDDRGASTATTASLVQALDWVVTSNVPVVNMSLSGPANDVLEATIKRIVAMGTVVVAAVGNEGPAGRPLFPAAYPQVVGVTAVDREDRIYRYANRGRQVMFAAPGVEIRVAGGDGDEYVLETGTSMAAPYATAIIAWSLAYSDPSPDRVLSALQAAARDLGEAGFDETYGFGRIVPRN